MAPADVMLAPGCSLGPDPCDQDRDSHRAVRCGGDDCDDLDCQRYPMNIEVADTLGHDEDCNPCTVSNVTPGTMRTGDGDAPYNDIEFFVFVSGSTFLNERHTPRGESR